jgi:predicted amidohydrolase
MNGLILSLVQSDLVWHDPSSNCKVFEAFMDNTKGKVDVFILPEMFATGFTMTPSEVAEPSDGPTAQWMLTQAHQRNAAICGSLAIREGNDYFNRFCFAHPDGQLDTYDKYHPYTPSGEARVYSKGTEIRTIVYRGWRIRPIICYDLRFPVFTRNSDYYDLLLCVANWPESRIQAWNALLRARAIENMAFSVGVNRIGRDAYRIMYSGASATYDMLGNEMLFLDIHTNQGQVSLDKELLYNTRKKLPFLEDRDVFILK